MTEHEQDCIGRLADKVEHLIITVERSLERETSCRAHVAMIHSEVFGSDGNQDHPGLKGLVRDLVQSDAAKAKQLAEIATTVNGDGEKPGLVTKVAKLWEFYKIKLWIAMAAGTAMFSLAMYGAKHALGW